jgi:hypothetical protein
MNAVSKTPYSPFTLDKSTSKSRLYSPRCNPSITTVRFSKMRASWSAGGTQESSRHRGGLVECMVGVLSECFFDDCMC